MTVNALAVILFLLFIISILLLAAATWIQVGGNGCKTSSTGSLPIKLKDTKLWMKGAVNEYPVRPPPPPAPPKKPCGDCHSCKCGSK